MKLYALVVRGKTAEWRFKIRAKPEHVEDWRRDGLRADEILNIVPQWIIKMGLTRVWCFLQGLVGL